jgi:hypothetical protein
MGRVAARVVPHRRVRDEDRFHAVPLGGDTAAFGRQVEEMNLSGPGLEGRLFEEAVRLLLLVQPEENVAFALAPPAAVADRTERQVAEEQVLQKPADRCDLGRAQAGLSWPDVV